MFKLDEKTQAMANGPRTVTAEKAPAGVACKKCGATEPRKYLWGISARGFTTAELSEVDYWLCKECFSNG